MRAELVKVTLYVYPQLRGLIEASEVAAVNRAVLSYKDPRATVDAAADVLEESLYACGLRQLADDTAAVLQRFTEPQRALLAHKYFRRGEAPSRMRNYYRYQRAIFRRVSRDLSLAGWTDERFLAFFSGYAPFVRILRTIREKGERGLIRNHPRPACARAKQVPQ